jgi:hypothetical protein
MTEDQFGALIAGVLITGASWGLWRVAVAAASGRIRVNAALGCARQRQPLRSRLGRRDIGRLYLWFARFA